jgi:hypothetical protein
VSKPAVSPHEDRRTATAQRAFVELCGPAQALIRSVQIEHLPAVEWKGRTLRTLRCEGSTGKGPHDVHVPESLLWSLISLTHYHCPYHANALADPVPEEP